MVSSGEPVLAGPGGVFVVGGVVAQAGVQDGDEPVGEGAEGLVVGSAAGALAVVVAAGATGGGEGGEGLLVEGVGETPVPGPAGQHDAFGAGSLGDRRHAGVVLPGPGVGVAVGVIPHLGEHPGGEDRPEPGLAQVDLSVRVLAKTLP